MAKTKLTAERKPASAIKPGRFTVKLRSVGNPDHRQYAPVSDPVTVFVNSLREASEECRKYQAEWDLGGGNWPDTFVLENGVKVARISYNGRVWDLGGNEINIATDEEIGRKFYEYQREMGPKLDASLRALCGKSEPKQAGYHTRPIVMPTTKREGLANFVQLAINLLEGGDTKEALLTLVDLHGDLTSNANPYAEVFKPKKGRGS